MKITKIAVALATVTTLSVGVARADVMPYSAVLGAQSGVGSATVIPAIATSDVETKATEVAFPSAVTSDDGDKKAKKVSYLLVPAGLGAAFLAQGMSGGKSSEQNGGGSGIGSGMPGIQPPTPQVSPVPELSSSLLVLTGLALLALMYRRRPAGSSLSGSSLSGSPLSGNLLG